MSRSRIRILSILFATAILAIAVLSVAGMPAASASPERLTGVKFVLEYRGSLNGTWHNTYAVDQSKCIGDDFSGSFTSSVRPGSKRFTVVVDSEFGHRPFLDWGANQGTSKGVVTSNRTAQGWLMKYSGGECHPVQKDESGCGAHTFAGQVGLEPVGGSFGFNRNRVYLNWALEPEPAIGCDDGVVYDSKSEAPNGAGYGKLDVKKLYRCGFRKPRRCKLTIGRSSNFSFHDTKGPASYTSTVHIEWSVTFVAVGRR